MNKKELREQDSNLQNKRKQKYNKSIHTKRLKVFREGILSLDNAML
ncbi:hypothetical protein SAMN05216323_10016 [Williamwhitmania taraxaci]|uniref:Uncharacterized protein n=1 Tax=Williamwhitmania taraxaci TaxID=1640674 RepID=A0A1G6GG76_9BACT|nr:hypothetical protein SAMN05216323_10016 [Williamwhitmania taraxaci]